jgi:hypothetical protein
MAGNFLFAWNNKPENGMPFKSMASSTETEIKNKFTSTTSAGYVNLPWNLRDGRRTSDSVQVNQNCDNFFYNLIKVPIEI